MTVIPPHRDRRYGRAGAIGLLAAGVFAGTLTTAAPANAAAAPPNTVRPAETVTAAPSVKPPPVRTRSHLRAARSVVVKGRYVKMRGTVTYGSRKVHGALARLQVRRGSTWQTIRRKPIPARGTTTFQIRPMWSHHYRLVYAGDHRLARSVSKPIRVKVVKPRHARNTGARARVMAVARSLRGRPYVFGAAGPRAFDCSGYTKYVFRKVRVSLPHKADLQKRRGVHVRRGAARPGDLVLFLRGGYAYHVGIYAGGSYMYDSPRPGATVGKHKIWSRNVTFRRVL